MIQREWGVELTFHGIEHRWYGPKEKAQAELQKLEDDGFKGCYLAWQWVRRGPWQRADADD